MKLIAIVLIATGCSQVQPYQQPDRSYEQYCFDKYLEANRGFIRSLNNLDSMNYFDGKADAYWEMYVKTRK